MNVTPVRIGRRELGIVALVTAAVVGAGAVKPWEALSAADATAEKLQRKDYLPPDVLSAQLDRINSKYPEFDLTKPYPADRNHIGLTTDARKYVDDIFYQSLGKMGFKWDTQITLPPGDYIVQANVNNTSMKPTLGLSYARGIYPFILTPDIINATTGEGIWRVSSNEEPVVIAGAGGALRLSPNYVPNEQLNRADITTRLWQFKQSNDTDGAIAYLKGVYNANPAVASGQRPDDPSAFLPAGHWLLFGPKITVYDVNTLPWTGSLSTILEVVADTGDTHLMSYRSIDRVAILPGEKVRVPEGKQAIYLGGPSKPSFLPLASQNAMPNR